MNIFKSIIGYRTVHLDRLSDKETVSTMSGVAAYICLACPTKTIMESAPHGVCPRCGSSSIAPVLNYVETALRWKWQVRKERMQEKREKAKTPRNNAYELTAREK